MQLFALLRKSGYWLWVFLLLPWLAIGQSNPAPIDLSSGNYALTDWPSNSAAGTYPPGMRFHTCTTANAALATATSGDYTGVYNGSTGPRVAGLGINGFYIANTLSDAPSIGGAVLALNSVGRTNLAVSFQIATHLAGNAANVRLQYRNSIYSPWADVPGPVEYVSNGATSASPTLVTANLSTLTSNAVDNRPGLQLRWKYYYTSGTATTNCAIRIDEINVTSAAVTSDYIATGQVINTVFCITPTVGVSATVPFNYGPVSTFPAGTVFTAELSSSTGSFTTPVQIGSVVSDGSGTQSIAAIFPANTITGSGYRVRVMTSSPAVTGTNNASDIILSRSPTDVTNAIVYAGGYRATLSWGAPTSCFDDFLVVGKSGNNHSGAPSGNGSTYTANALFGQGSPLGGGYVVYKGNGYGVAVTGLKGDTSYYFTIWARYQNDWIGTTVLIVTPPYINPAVYNSRKLLQGEYFWNSDPGQGNGIPILAADGNMDAALENLFASGINPPRRGASTFSMRVKNQTGSWGPLFSTVINVDSSDVAQLTSMRRVTQAEYFWNTDPGAGSGTALIAFDGALDQALEQVYKNGVAAPRQGQSTFNVRVKDRSNFWGPVFSTVISVDSFDVARLANLRRVTQAEYFWNTDPGAGNATALLAFDGAFDQALEQLNRNGITVPRQGQSTFNVRVRDRDNVWGPVFSTVVNVDSFDVARLANLRRVTQAEFFWNTDPGIGNGLALLAFDGSLDQALEQLYKNGMQAPRNGQNTFNLRVRDRDNSWGPLFSTVVNVDSNDVAQLANLRRVTQAEYYWNTDPGEGNGTALICFDGNYNQALEQALKNGVALPRSGQNLLGVRAKDRDNTWGPAFKTIINVDSTDTNRSFTRRRVRRAEFWFDRDPGEGNGTLMNIADGYGDQPLETAIRNNLPLLPNGVHLLGVRVQDRDNTWGPSFKTTVSVDTMAQNSFQVYTNPSYTRKCAGSSVTMRALGAVSYVWSPATGLNTTTGDSVIATPASTTTYTVIGTNVSSLQDTAYVTVEIQQSAAITASRPLIFCQGDSTVLTSNVSVGNYWNTGAYSQSITVKSTDTYVLTTDNECGVTSASLTVVNQTPVVTSTVTPVSCNGGSNGSISLSVNSDTVAATNNPGLLLSEVFTNPSGNDSPFEWVELVATDYVDFSVKPYTVIMANNGPSSSKGWVQGGTPTVVTNSTYAFQISSGNVVPGQVVYVGGSSMAPTGTKLRVINTATTGGDGGLGGAFLSTGVLGNGGGLADGIAVFSKPVNQIDSNTVPVDALFFGTGIGGAALADTSKGFALPVNDLYSGGRLKSTSYFAPDPLSAYISCTGTYNRSTGVYSAARTWMYGTAYTNNATGVSVASNINYSWSNGRPTKDISGLSAGTYSVTVTSQIGCTTTQSYAVSQPAALSLITRKTNSICYGYSDGSASVSVSGGVTPYSYLWSTGATASSIANRPAGTYNVQVTDSNGCTATASVTIGQPPAIIISTFSPSSANVGASVVIRGTGFTGANGVSFGGVPASAFTLSGDTQIIAVVPAGALSGNLTVTNTAGCYGNGPIPFQFVASFATVNVTMIVEGYYDVGFMQPALVNQGVSSNYLDVDSVQAFLFDSLNTATPVATVKGLLDAYGNVSFPFPGIHIGGRYYLAVRTRNALMTFSSQTLLLSSVNSYDFTDDAAKAYGGNMAEVEPGVWAVFSGDLNQDDFIDTFDSPLLELDNLNFATGYYATDLNGDGFVDTFDSPAYEKNNINFILTLRP